ncbi:unnamed protein product [Macrosiphum euphorbiae]|uniref:Uncharacterized protein n=1 Tax=Macrosiphum euphorbiae TaxID=13131 RepID=A0AAV0X0Q5_9HEMI|nr:unnamed protein product [Macrosiphum euphorbiae]
MSSSDDDLLMASAAFVIMNSLLKKEEKKKRRHRRWWMTSTFKSRITYSGSNLLEDLRREDSGHFNNFCRMPPATFDVLLEMITPMIKKEDTNFRKAIPPQERLALTLHFLATGNS